MTYERIRDPDIVRLVLTNPRVYPNLTDDFSPSAEEFIPILHDGVWYLAVKDGDDLLGLVVFVQYSRIVFDMHPILTPECWWSFRQKQAVLGAMDWIWRNTEAERIVAAVPILKYRTKLRFPPQLGMTQYGVHPLSFMKHGKLCDQALFGISRSEIGPAAV